MAVQFLTTLERLRYEQLPAAINIDDLTLYFHLEPSEIALITGQRRDENRLGFAAQLCIIKFMGYLPDNWLATISKEAIEKIADQLGIPSHALSRYGNRTATKTEHLQAILKHLGFSKWAPIDLIPLEKWLVERALEHDKPTLLLDLACEKLILQKILRPTIGTLERIVISVRVKAYEETYIRLNMILSTELKEKLDIIISGGEANRYTVFGWLKEEPNANTPSQINKALKKYLYLKELGVEQWDISLLNPNRRKFLAQKARRSTNQELERLIEVKRYTLLVAFLSQSLIDITDSVLDMFGGFMDDILHKSKRDLEEYQHKTANAKDDAMATLSWVASVIVDEENIAAEDIRSAIFSKIPKEELNQAVNISREMLKPTRNSFLSFLDNYHKRIRHFSSNFLKSLVFHSPINDRFLYAVEIIRGFQSGSKKRIPNDVPVFFITPTWAKYVFDDDGNIIKRAYESCVLFNLKDRLNSGDIYVSNSRRYADPEGYLIPKIVWADSKEEVCRQLHISPEPLGRIDEKIKEYEQLLPLVGDLLIETDEIRLEDGALVLPRLQALDIPDSAIELEQKISSRLPLVDLPELLMEVNSWTGFTSHLTSIHDGKPPGNSQINRVYASLLSNACNIPWTDMSRSSNIEYHDLLWSIRSYQREDTLKLANNHLVNQHHNHWLAAHWGGGTLSSSDGQRFPVSGKIRSAAAQVKYFGYGKGVTFYTHTSDQYSQYGSKVIASTERDAMYVLDEILNNETELNILEHTTDTSGYTDIVFGLFDLLGMQFSPRLRDIKDQKLSKIKGKEFDYPSLKFTGVVNPNYIASRWDDLLRIAGSMKQGYVTASLFISKLQSYPRQNNLTYVLQEYGRLVKTVFILRYLVSQSLRRKINTQLNKGEALHALRNFLWFGGDGKIRKKQEEQQREQALCLNVATNCVVLWNTVYMQEVLKEMESEGDFIDPDDIGHLSPSRFAHINRLGKYSFEFNANQYDGGLRGLRRNSLE